MNRRNAEASLLIFAAVLAFGAMLMGALAEGRATGPVTAPAGSAVAGVFPHTLFIVAICLVCHVVARRFAPHADPVILPCAIALAGIGFAMVNRLDHSLAGPQMLWLAIGAAAFCLTLVVLRDHRKLESFRYTLLLIGVVVLMLPFAPVVGRTIRGARLWVSLGPITFQPAEIAKIVLAMFLAGYLAAKREVMTVKTAKIGPISLPAPRHFGPLLIAWGLSLAIMVGQRDLGTSVLFLSLFIITIYVATSQSAYVWAGSGMFLVGIVVANNLFAHVHQRIASWLNPWADVNGHGFQIAQSLFALGAGNIGGTGIGRGRPDLIKFAVPTDFIFSAIGEELGLVGATAVLLLFAVIVARGFHIALRSRDPLGQILATGLTSIIAVQTFLIIGGVTRLIPLTGITLPFVSYGGSSIVSNFVLIALLLRISNAEAGAAPEPEPIEVPA